MRTKIIETSTGFNWGKFLVGRFSVEEWAVNSRIDHFPVIAGRGWSHKHIFVMDLQTGEGAMFIPNIAFPEAAKVDLDKHKIWVCPMFEPFLKWLYAQDLQDLTKLPSLVEFTMEEAPPSMTGYRREGK
jgi:hypothetical protein